MIVQFIAFYTIIDYLAHAGFFEIMALHLIVGIILLVGRVRMKKAKRKKLKTVEIPNMTEETLVIHDEEIVFCAPTQRTSFPNCISAMNKIKIKANQAHNEDREREAV